MRLGDDQGCADHHQTLRPGRVDQRAGRRLRGDAGDRRDRHHHADARLVPFLFGEEIDGEIGAKPLADIGQKEIGGIKRARRAPQAVDILALQHLSAPCCVPARPDNSFDWKVFQGGATGAWRRLPPCVRVPC